LFRHARLLSTLKGRTGMLVRIAVVLGVALPALAQVNSASPHGKLAIPCQNCHTTTSWSPLRPRLEFDHNTATHFQLRGMHQNVACNSCHVSKVFTDVGTRCADCHADLHKRQFGAQCERCHSVTGWRENTRAIQDHWNRFPLIGSHMALSCDSCHPGAAVGVYVGLSIQCYSCHARDYQTGVIDHRAAGFPITCETCHNVDNWQTVRFDHTRFANFALSGAHINLACTACHVGNRFQGVPTDCAGCHLTDFTKTTNPNHVAAGFSRDCATCHQTASWLGATFNHNLTKFPLTGSHASATCVQCHINGNYTNISTDCVSCHMKDFQSATTPNHVAASFPVNCQLCHSTKDWTGATFDHSTTKFPLLGKHATVTCAQCHSNGQYATLSMACSSCHLKDFQGATNPNHVSAGFPQDCQLCHTSMVDWTGATFNHTTQTTFALTGKHVTATCLQCHSSGVYKGLAASCDSCHLKDFQGATNPNHMAAGFPLDCSVCHTTTDWTGAAFNHTTQTTFPLTGKHVTATCLQCHSSGVYKGLAQACNSCHLKDFHGATNPNHVAAGFPLDCSVCHSTTDWTGATFNHTTQTTFPLTGKHVTATCLQCHASGVYKGLPVACNSCHLKDFQGTTNPNHVAAGFPQDCSVCHTTIDWNGATFNHTTQTAFPLTGKHITATCTQCHASGVFKGLAMACNSCHLKDYQGTTNPNHAAAGFPQDCSVCHTTTDWSGAVFNHTTQTKFPLTGAHIAATCAQCHSSGVFAGLSMDCYSCHSKDFQGAKNPNHVAGGFPQDCHICHTTTAWTPASFDHNNTKFPLTGSHVAVACAQCHTAGQYVAISTACNSCHLKDYQGTTNPNHAAAGFPQDCSLCHTTTNWSGATFNHNTQTTFPLTGKHITTTCQQCHASGVYKGLATACNSCHLKDYQGTTNPNHVAAGFPQDCSLCHTTTDWTGAVFNHNTQTTFPLTGKHITTTCQQCHASGVYKGLATACNSCHLKDYQGATNPNHVAAGFPQDCSLCHTTTDWTGATFNHTTQTTFPLTGKHITTTCQQCHASGVYKGLATACNSCHLKDYQGTTNPNHVAAGFPQDCSLCHTTTDWTGAIFNHNTQTTFPLTGKHITTTCVQCHASGVYKGLATACNSCHLKDYQGATNPNHVAAGFPQDCSLCHTTTDWTGAIFNHNTQTTFPLTGMHTTVTCVQCHASGVYKGLATACNTCHLKDFQGTTNPNHVTAGFPQDCTLCHTTAGWTPSTFNHSTTKFPLTGAHAAATCVQCHSSGQYATLSTACNTCHLKDYQGTNNPNHAAAGFPLDCSQCHTTVDWSGAKFDHTAQTTFPLTGAHITATCLQCHSSGVYKGLSTACNSCHLTDYQGTNNPNHVAAGFPQDCSMCHTTTNWAGATFNHTTQTTFPLTGAHVNATCNQCHASGVYKGLSTACNSCHLTDYQGTNNPNHAAAAFPQDCSLCHTTTNWAGATFNHTTQTTFPLTGAHVNLTCIQCHSSGVYKGLATACYSCHSTDYKSATNPNHATLGYPQDCSLCHSTTDWTSATFNHSSVGFNLVGKHATAQCVACHVGGNFTTTPTDCYSCHTTEYNSTTNPNHVAAGFPKTCLTCHPATIIDWTGATFNHTWFPMTHGNANSVCSTCHTNSSDYSVFSCTGCHLKTQTDSNHSGVRNYVYNSTNCYSCHPTGRGG
jgi:glutamate mutase epsilon subunit